MSETLEKTFDKIRALPPERQAEFQTMLEHALAGESDEDPADWSPEYRAYVEQALEEAEQDRLADRVYSMEQIRAKHQERMKALYG